MKNTNILKQLITYNESSKELPLFSKVYIKASNKIELRKVGSVQIVSVYDEGDKTLSSIYAYVNRPQPNVKTLRQADVSGFSVNDDLIQISENMFIPYMFITDADGIETLITDMYQSIVQCTQMKSYVENLETATQFEKKRYDYWSDLEEKIVKIQKNFFNLQIF